MGDNGVSARELYELKQKAMAFYAENGVPQKMEEILNSTFYDQPKDVYGHIANYFQRFSCTPTVTKLKARQAIDSKGQPTLQTEVYCIVRNNEKLVTTTISSSENHEPDHAVQEERDEEDMQRQKAVDKAIQYIQGVLGSALAGQDPTKQQDADTTIMNIIEKLRVEEEERIAKEKAENPDAETEGGSRPVSVSSAKKGAKSPKGGKGKGGAAVVVIPDEPREKTLCGCNAVSAISRALCEAGSSISDLPLYSHIYSLKNRQAPEKMAMPVPMVTIIAGGRAYPGKSNCVKEFMVIPKPGLSFSESVRMVNNIYTSVSKTLTVKAGITARLASDTGALCPSMDRPEAGLDMLQEAVTALGLTAGEDVFFALNCGLQEAFDHEKGKYEVMAGALKTGEDLIEFWADLQSRYPAVIALIDPMRKQDKEPWMKLCERVSDQCLIVGDFVYHRPGLLKDEELPEDFKTSGVILKVEQMNTISDILDVATKMQEAENAVVISSSVAESPDSFIADLAVGSGARFIKVGAPCRGERIAKLNRLIQIEAELEANRQLDVQPALTFPHLELPPPPPEEEGEDGAASPQKSVA